MNPDAIMISKLYLDSIPVGLLGIVHCRAAGLASFPTIDAELNAGATVLAKDIWQRVRRKTPPIAIEQLRFSRT